MYEGLFDNKNRLSGYTKHTENQYNLILGYRIDNQCTFKLYWESRLYLKKQITLRTFITGRDPKI
jgi:hypothetical protein